ncbi:MAG: hypothetical protein Q8L85_01790 [Alphaproteobacteria bacterium]|nr:hypothetical protein [Alphaproteobacteria bacterium]
MNYIIKKRLTKFSLFLLTIALSSGQSFSMNPEELVSVKEKLKKVDKEKVERTYEKRLNNSDYIVSFNVHVSLNPKGEYRVTETNRYHLTKAIKRTLKAGLIASLEKAHDNPSSFYVEFERTDKDD